MASDDLRERLIGAQAEHVRSSMWEAVHKCSCGWFPDGAKYPPSEFDAAHREHYADALLPLIDAECSEAARQAAEGAREATEHDRRELWRLNNFLIVNGTTATHRDRQRALSDYLHRTCTHDWADVSGWGGCPKGTHQCDWCNAVLTPDEWDALARAASLARQTADGGGEE